MKSLAQVLGQTEVGAFQHSFIQQIFPEVLVNKGLCWKHDSVLPASPGHGFFQPPLLGHLLYFSDSALSDLENSSTAFTPWGFVFPLLHL